MVKQHVFLSCRVSADFTGKQIKVVAWKVFIPKFLGTFYNGVMFRSLLSVSRK